MLRNSNEQIIRDAGVQHGARFVAHDVNPVVVVLRQSYRSFDFAQDDKKKGFRTKSTTVTKKSGQIKLVLLRVLGGRCVKQFRFPIFLRLKSLTSHVFGSIGREENKNIRSEERRVGKECRSRWS